MGEASGEIAGNEDVIVIDFQLAIACDQMDCEDLLTEWRWIVPRHMTAIQMGIFGDWLFGAPDGSIWHLSALDGVFGQVDANSVEYNRKKRDAAFTNELFQAEWAGIAIENGIVPKENECLSWKIAPLIGGPFTVDNIQVFDRWAFNSFHGQVFRQLLTR